MKVDSLKDRELVRIGSNGMRARAKWEGERLMLVLCVPAGSTVVVDNVMLTMRRREDKHGERKQAQLLTEAPQEVMITRGVVTEDEPHV